MKLLETKKNPLLHREEIVFVVENQATPSKEKVRKDLASELKKPEENIVIERIDSKFGIQKFTGEAKVYDNVKDKEKYETLSRKAKKKIKEEAAKKAEEEKKAAAKTEEPKEEASE